MKSLHLGILSCSFVFLVAFDGLAQPFTLPSLTYSYDALEPSIDAMTMEIHLTKHHQAYVNNLNKAVAGTPMEQLSLEVILIGAGRRGDAVRNNGGGHYNHTLFWEILSPKAAKEPSGALAKAITETFGSLDSLKSSLNKAASTRFGSGWAWLVVTPDKKLVVTSSPNQDNPIMDISPVRGLPILGIDVWEHAYYLKYQNKRGDYLSAIWEVLDWQAVSAKYDAALINPFLKRIELDTWTELTTFHSIISETFHPAEEGNLKPAKERSGELVEKARLLKSSAVPTSFRNNVVRKSLDRLVAEAVNLDKLVKAKKDDKEIKKSLYLLHDRFHDIMEECNH